MSQRKPPDDDSARDPRDDEHSTGRRPQARPPQGWGATRPLDGDALGSALPTPMRPEPGRAFARDDATAEPAVRVARSVITGGNPAPDRDDAARPAAARPAASSPRPPQGQAERTHLLGSEPLRTPAGRPAPASYPSAKSTLLMTDTNAQAQAANAGRTPASPRPAPTTTGQRAPAAPRAEHPAPVSAGRQPTGILSRADAEMQDAAARSMPATAANGARPGTPNGARPPESTRPLPTQSSDSEPLRLQLDEGDMLEQPVDAGGGPDRVPTRGPGMLIAIIVLLIAAGAGIWYGMISRSAPAAELPPTRNDGEVVPAGTAPPTTPAATAPVAPATATPTAVPAAPTAPTQPPAAVAPAASAAATEPKAAEPAREEARTAQPSATSKAPARKPAKRRNGASAASPAYTGEAAEDVAAAREALRSLETGPVMKVKPSEEAPPPADEGSSLAPPPPPEPPPPPPE